jgi:glycosyltransferase involved in cell wall biosynthesis
MVLTWGLLGPGKGIEWGIRALAEQPGVTPSPRYVVAGQTHPKIVSESGEAYRESLASLARELGVESQVEFDGRYRDEHELASLVAEADAVLLAYDSREQSTSGVLVEAIAAGKPVIATRFPHAVELLSGGGGVLVGHQDPRAIADALHRILDRRDQALATVRVESSLPPSSWETVAEQYRELAASLAETAAA